MEKSNLINYSTPDEPFENNEEEGYVNMNASLDENLELNNKIAFFVRKEFEKLELNQSISEKVKPKSLATEIKDAIKFEIINKDSGTKRDYKLTAQTKFEHFYDYFSSELRTNDLLYIIDSNTKPNREPDEATIEKHKFKVRDILINRVDQIYHSKVVHMKNPVEILNKIKEIKRCETNLTSVSIRKQLYSIQYVPGKDKASEFCDKFEEVIRNFESLPETNLFSDEEKRDAFYNAIMATVPEVQAVEFMTNNTTGKSLTYDQLKTFVLQAEANKNQGLATCPRAVFKTQKREPKDRCFECDDYGHFERDCPYKGRGLKKCYECNEFTTHIAAECPQRLAQLRIKPRAGRGRLGSRINNRYGNFNRNNTGGKFLNNKTRGFKRKSYDNERGNDPKKLKFTNSKTRKNSNYNNAKNQKWNKQNQPKQQEREVYANSANASEVKGKTFSLNAHSESLNEINIVIRILKIMKQFRKPLVTLAKINSLHNS